MSNLESTGKDFINKSPITPLSISQAIKLELSTAPFLFPQPSTEVCHICVPQGATEVCHRGVPQRCATEVCLKGVPQRCATGVCHRGVRHARTEVCHRGVPQRCATEVCQLPATNGLYHVHEDKFVLCQHGERQFGNDISLLIC